MEDEVRRAADLRRSFLEVHPNFRLRTKLEQQLGELELVLGNYDRAYRAWQWVAANTNDNIEWAMGMVEAMEQLELVGTQ